MEEVGPLASGATANITQECDVPMAGDMQHCRRAVPYPHKMRIDLQNLTLLHCTPLFLAHPDFPASLPRVTILRLFGSRSHIHFGTVFAQFPRLQELTYDAWNRLSPPTGGEPVPLSLIRLHSAVTVVRDWIPIEDHFTLLGSPAFPEVKRIVLYGTWHRVVADAHFLRFRSALHARGCQLEFPEGNVLSP
ncbi:hypothetical protein GGX14DRAFT_601056 [Mycena pura]|uniref:Uncharacterized protein n=1 Tax=Mycena pura TaxID=153505 RepID=A0AAD6Y0M4_9AGAR|nr:hypothetical protein GGX14DRAFT_601056 [Mycena pura]